MSDSQQKSSRDLFKEIDALCEEVDMAVADHFASAGVGNMQGAMNNLEARDRAGRVTQYARLLSCRIVDVEVQPTESPRARAFLTIRCSSEYLRHSVEVTECFGLIEYLLAHSFSVMASGKCRRDRDSRDDDDRVLTWFILGKGECES